MRTCYVHEAFANSLLVRIWFPTVLPIPPCHIIGGCDDIPCIVHRQSDGDCGFNPVVLAEDQSGLLEANGADWVEYHTVGLAFQGSANAQTWGHTAFMHRSRADSEGPVEQITGLLKLSHQFLSKHPYPSYPR